MLGKMSSLTEVVKVLNEVNVRNFSVQFPQSTQNALNQIDNYAITEFVQGQTRRWAIAWSFTNERLPEVTTLPDNNYNAQLTLLADCLPHFKFQSSKHDAYAEYPSQVIQMSQE